MITDLCALRDTASFSPGATTALIAECTLVVDVFAGVAGQRDFEIVDGGRSVQRERGGVAAVHQIDQHGRQTALDHVTAQAPDDGPPLGARGGDGVYHRAKPIGRQQARKRIQQAGDTGILLIHGSEVHDLDLAAPLLEANCFEIGELQRRLGVNTHAA